MSESVEYERTIGSERTFTHFDEAGHPHMVDVTSKPMTERIAVAVAKVKMSSVTRQCIEAQKINKGDVLAIAALAGIMGAKKTAELIPLCHPLPLSKVEVNGTFDETKSGTGRDNEDLLTITATVKTTSQTGVEMEALTACTTAALTVYDMCKAIDREMVIQDVQLLYKTGGETGTYERRSV